MQPVFLITIDTEGDNLWARPRSITTRNAAFLPRFQQLCERYGLSPVWLTNYEMACCPQYVEFARDVQRRGTGEIGMHLHAWNSPPLTPLTADDFAHQPYLMEYPEAVLREKVHVLTELLRERFAAPIASHRAGRWGLSGAYVRALAAEGYRVDCSVVPGISFRAHRGAPAGAGGPDYSAFPARPYRLDPADLSRPAADGLWEVPLTVASLEPPWIAALTARPRLPALLRRACGRRFPSRAWLRPRGGNALEMIRIVRRASREQWPCVEFMLHSSELMPGGSPVFPTAASIARLYGDLEALFSAAAPLTTGATLSGFVERRLSA